MAHNLVRKGATTAALVSAGIARPRIAASGGTPPHDPESWAARYIDLPFVERGRDWAGVDCWGLPHLALWEEFGCETPRHETGYVTCRQSDVPEIAALIEAGKPGWHVVAEAPYYRDELAGRARPPAPKDDYWICPLGDERPGDLLLIRQYGQPCHFGLVAGGGHMLHTEEGINAKCVPYVDRDWRRRIVGIYRHPGLVHP
jgi:cell wall-associated NlpC family hydrolase